MSMQWVTADDGNGNTFKALTAHPYPAPEEHVPVWVFIDGPNGWQANVGELSMHSLKRTNNAHFMS